MQPYFRAETLPVGAMSFELAVKEITEEEEHRSCEQLAILHYRGHEMHGRTAKLALRAFHPSLPHVLGYVQLATPFFMNKARARILDAPFRNSAIGWDSWNKATLRQFVHLVVRIGRVVVAPEFRGLGVAQILLRHAFAFASERWQVAGYKPYFAEISADMLKFVPFAERAGMTFVGQTEGNLHRVVKDMKYLIGRFGTDKSGQSKFEDICGICDEQIARMNHVLRIMSENDLTLDELTEKLESLSRRHTVRDLALLQDVVSLPKPHYMKGLNPEAEAFLERRVRELGVRPEKRTHYFPERSHEAPIEIVDLTLGYTSRVRRTRSAHAVQQAFGISPDELKSLAIEGLSLQVAPGEILLVTGPSGCGKTTLLRAIDDRARSKNCGVEAGTIHLPTDASVGSLGPLRSRRPLIEALGVNDLRHALDVLNMAGLSEAFLYLRRFDELSAGQQYRAMLAKLLASQHNVWLADEFCANLDSVTASVVARGVQRLARKVGATVIAAAADCHAFAAALLPDRVLLLRSSLEFQVIQGGEYLKSFGREMPCHTPPPRMRLTPKQMALLLEKGTVEISTPEFCLGRSSLIIAERGNKSEIVRIRRCPSYAGEMARTGSASSTVGQTGSGNDPKLDPRDMTGGVTERVQIRLERLCGEHLGG